MRARQYYCDNNELVEVSVPRYKEQGVYAFVETPMPHAIQIRQTGGPEVLNWTPIEVGEPGSGEKGSLFLTRPFLLHYIERRDAFEASGNELFKVVASGRVRINANQRIALKDAADAHKASEARATSGSTILTI